MSKRIPFSLLFAAFFAAFAMPLAAQNIEQEVSDFAQKWQEAFNRADAAALGAMYSDQVISYNADGSSVTVSKADIEASFVKDFSEYSLQTAITLRSMMAQPGGKVKVSGTYTNKGSLKKTGEAIAETGKFEHEVVQEGGVWKLCALKVMPAK